MKLIASRYWSDTFDIIADPHVVSWYVHNMNLANSPFMARMQNIDGEDKSFLEGNDTLPELK